MSTALKPTLKKKIVESLDELPTNKLAQVYDFIEFLKVRKSAVKSTKPAPTRKRRRDTLGQRLIAACEDVLAGRTREFTCAEDILRDTSL